MAARAPLPKLAQIVGLQGLTMNLTRRNMCQLGVLLVRPTYLLSAFGQANKARDTLHPPEPAEQEVDMILHGRKSRQQPPTGLCQRRQEFSDCLKRIVDAAAKLEQIVAQLPISEVFSVQAYRETELLERLAKHLKRLSKD
jgi:hypothetical protein